jgi:hypothetical protein
MVQGALLCPGWPGKRVVGNARAMVRRSAWAHRARRRGRTCHRHIAAALRARILGGRRAQDPTPRPACRPFRSEYGINQDTLARAPAKAASWPTRRRIRRAKLVHKSAFGRLRPGRVRRHTAGTGRRSAGPAGPHRPNGPGLPSTSRASIGEQASGDEVADRVVLGYPAQLTIAEPETRETRREPARRGRRRIASRSLWSHARRILDGLPRRHESRLCQSAAGQIRKTCGVPAYLRVVIEKHRTQASRTMNAETAQADTGRVN